MQMMESIIEMLFCLSLSALILLIGSCIVGSMSAALRAVIGGSDGEREEAKEMLAFGAELTVLDDRVIETGVIVMTNPENHYGL
jgi:hypothetical protein